MDLGYVLDHGHGTTTVAEWVEGRPERSFWTGLRLRGKKLHPVSAYRCSSCGYLEFFAR